MPEGDREGLEPCTVLSQIQTKTAVISSLCEPFVSLLKMIGKQREKHQGCMLKMGKTAAILFFVSMTLDRDVEMAKRARQTNRTARKRKETQDETLRQRSRSLPLFLTKTFILQLDLEKRCSISRELLSNLCDTHVCQLYLYGRYLLFRCRMSSKMLG
jgi:hypothetical protein